MRSSGRKSAVSMGGVGAGASTSSRQQRQSAKRHQRPDCTFVFFEQRHPRAGQRRTKKSPDELPPMAKIGGLQQPLRTSASLAGSVSPGAAAVAASSISADASGSDAPFVPVSGSLQLPVQTEAWGQGTEPTAAPVVDDWDEQRRIYNAWRLESTDLLAKLGDALSGGGNKRQTSAAAAAISTTPVASLPRYMEIRLTEGWSQLVADCRQEHRQWQTVACLEESRRRQAEEADREAKRAAQRAENDSMLMRDGTSRSRASAALQAQRGGRTTTAAGAAAAGTPGSGVGGSGLGKKSAGVAGRSRTILHDQAIAEGAEPPPTQLPPRTAEHHDTLSFSLTSKESLRNGWLQNFNQRLIEDKLQSALVKLRLVGHASMTGGTRTQDAAAGASNSSSYPLTELKRPLGQLELQFYATANAYRPSRPRRVLDGPGGICGPDQLRPLIDPNSLLPWPVTPPDLEARRAFSDRIAEIYRLATEGGTASAAALAVSTLPQPLLTDEEARLLKHRFRTSSIEVREAVLAGLLLHNHQPHHHHSHGHSHHQQQLPQPTSQNPDASAASPTDAALYSLLNVKLPARYRSVGARLLQCRSTEGTALLLYPSGNPALLHCAWSGAVLAFGDSPDRLERELLAAFNASACGFARAAVGVGAELTPLFTCTQSMAQLQDPVTGRVLKRLHWPSDPRAKLPINLQVRLNPSLTFVCAGRTDMTFSFSAEGRSVSVPIGFSAERETAVRQRCIDKMGNPTFSLSESLKIDGDRETILWKSDTAKKLIAKAKQMRKQQQQQQQLLQQQLMYQQVPRRQPDSAKSAATEASAGSSSSGGGGELTVRDPELEEVRARIKGICDSWLEAYRLRFGLAPPQAARRPPTMSASTNGGLGVGAFPPSVGRPTQSATPARSQTPRQLRHQLPPMRLPSAPSAVAAAASADPAAQPACPVAMRRLLVATVEGGSNAYSVGSNRCACGQTPELTDLELDAFLEAQGRRNPEQLLVIMVTDAEAGSDLLNQCATVALDQQRKRRPAAASAAAPCLSASRDPFRMFGYDLATASATTDCTYPALFVRHNLRPGDILVYRAGRILFAGGVSGPQQLRRLLAECRRLGERGSPGLPRDFKLPPNRPWDSSAVAAAAILVGRESASASGARAVTLDALTVLSASDSHPLVALPKIH